MASCIQIEGLLQSYVDEEVTPSERLLIEEHLRICEACATRLQGTRATAASMFEVLHQDRLCEDMTDRVMAHLPEITPSLSMTQSLRRQVAVEGKRTRRGLIAVARLVPVAMPTVLLILAGLLWFAWPSYNADTENVLGMVMHSDGGSATVYTTQGRESRVYTKNTITPGDRFETGADSCLLLGLTGPSHITVFENSVIEVRAPREIFLKEGRVFFDVLGESRQFQVQTPDGRITVFGTSFQVDVQTAGTEVTVANGEVLVENETAFLRLYRNTQAFFNPVRKPTIRQNIDATSCVREARAIQPDEAAERHFLEHLMNNAETSQPIPSEQVFVVETGGRPVSALLLKWTPDPYVADHAGYGIYVSDASMAPLFKAKIAPKTFMDKQQSEVRIKMPTDACNHETETLHITIIPEINYGRVETTFTEVAAIGGTS